MRATWIELIAVVLLAGCVAIRPNGARLSDSEAIRIAKDAARRDGTSLWAYQSPDARYYKDQRKWFVYFQKRGFFRAVGDHFGVSIDDQTGVARISYGK